MNDNLIPKQDGNLAGNTTGLGQINTIQNQGQSTGFSHEPVTKSDVVLPGAMPVADHNDKATVETTPAFIGMNTSSSRVAPQHIPVTSVQSPVQTPVQDSPKPASSYSALKPQPSVTSTTFSNSTPSVSAFTPVTHTNTHVSTTPHSMAKVWWTIISIFVILALAGVGYYFYSMSTIPEAEVVVDENNRSAFPSAVTANPIQNRPVDTTTNQPSRAPTARELFNAFIKQNINSLSPVKSASPFTIASIRFDGTNRAVVTYTDGRSTYNAAVSYAVSGSNISVTEFTLLTK